MPEVLYKINIYAIVLDVNNKEVESKELHEKVKRLLTGRSFSL